MQPEARTGWGHFAVALGAGAIVVSLWLPWYRLEIPPSLINQVDQSAPLLGAFAPLVHQGLELARQLGPLHVNAWQVFHTIDIVLLIVGIVAGGLALLAYSGRAAALPGLVAAAGAVGAVLALYRILVPPGPDGLLHPATGGYVALAGALAVLVGSFGMREGAVTGKVGSIRFESAGDAYDVPVAPAPGPAVPWAPEGSVPPPRA